MARPVVLVAGSLHHDVIVAAPHLPARDETVAGTGVTYAFGGKGGNQALAAARMGAVVHMAGAVGDDASGRVLLADLAQAGVDATRVQVARAQTGMSVAILESTGTYGAVIVSGANLAFDPAAVAFPKGLAALILQNEVPEAANLALAQRARTLGARVILNAAPARTTSTALLGLCDLLVVNRGEAEALLGMTFAAQDSARALSMLGPTEAIVTLGADGLSSSGFVQPPFPTTVISTHGAGDAFIGALVAEWARGVPLQRAARFGQAAASLHVGSAPAARAAVTEDRVRALLA